MTTTINASTVSGLIQSADTSGILQLQTANLPAVTIDASQNTTVNNSLTVNSNLTVTGSTTLNSSVIRSGTSQTASGTSVLFTGIPSWVKRITIMLNGVSTTGSSNLQTQIGSGSLTTTGYVSGSAQVGTSTTSSSTGFLVTGTNASTGVYYGSIIINNINSNIWVCNSSLWNSSNAMSVSGGSLSLSGTLDRVAMTTVNGTDTFDAGSINILYE